MTVFTLVYLILFLKLTSVRGVNDKKYFGLESWIHSFQRPGTWCKIDVFSANEKDEEA